MLTFILAVAVTIAVILLFVYIIRIYRTKSKYLNDKAIKNLAIESANKARKDDPFITCDFCGARIDTRLYTTCPQCGGAFGKDVEWSDRHIPDIGKANKHAKNKYNKLRTKVKDINQPTNRKIKILIGLLIAGIMISVGLFIYSNIQYEQKKLADQQVEYQYKPTGYGFGNVEILDDDLVEVCVGSVYHDRNFKGLHDYAVELNIINHSPDILEVGVYFDKANEQDVIALMTSRVPADNKWHRKILYLKDIHWEYLISMTLNSVVASKLNYVPVAGTGVHQTITSSSANQ